MLARSTVTLPGWKTSSTDCILSGDNIRWQRGIFAHTAPVCHWFISFDVVWDVSRYPYLGDKARIWKIWIWNMRSLSLLPLLSNLTTYLSRQISISNTAWLINITQHVKLPPSHDFSERHDSTIDPSIVPPRFLSPQVSTLTSSWRIAETGPYLLLWASSQPPPNSCSESQQPPSNFLWTIYKQFILWSCDKSSVPSLSNHCQGRSVWLLSRNSFGGGPSNAIMWARW